MPNQLGKAFAAGIVDELKKLLPKVDRVSDGNRHGTVIAVGEQVSEVKFDDGVTQFVANRWLAPGPKKEKAIR